MTDKQDEGLMISIPQNSAQARALIRELAGLHDGFPNVLREELQSMVKVTRDANAAAMLHYALDHLYRAQRRMETLKRKLEIATLELKTAQEDLASGDTLIDRRYRYEGR